MRYSLRYSLRYSVRYSVRSRGVCGAGECAECARRVCGIGEEGAGRCGEGAC